MDEFGPERLADIVSANAHQPAAEIIAGIFDSIDAFVEAPRSSTTSRCWSSGGRRRGREPAEPAKGPDARSGERTGTGSGNLDLEPGPEPSDW